MAAETARPTVLAVFAHPDDESLACGGTLARLADAGVRVVLFCASRGTRGHLSDPALAGDGDLGRLRVEELHAAADVLGISQVIVRDHPDGHLRWVDAPGLHDDIAAAIREHRPDAVITFAEDGLYWHADHIAMHERTLEVIDALGASAPPLYHVTMPKGAMHEVVRAAEIKGWTPPPLGFWSIVPNAFGILAPPPSLRVDVGDWVPRKLAALLCHRSQMGLDNPFGRLEREEARRLLGTELFRPARPGARAPLLEAIGTPVPDPEQEAASDAYRDA